jgi:predicted component of type VI protein secretion system
MKIKLLCFLLSMVLLTGCGSSGEKSSEEKESKPKYEESSAIPLQIIF